MYTFLVILIIIASILLVLSVLAQSPKSGMAANFGASNQVMGVRESANILEKTTWTLAGLIVALSLVATISMESNVTVGTSLQKDAEALMEHVNTTSTQNAMPQAELPAETPAE